MSYKVAKGIYIKKWGVNFNEGSFISRWLPTIHINYPKHMYYFAYPPLKIRTYYYNPKLNS